MMITKCKRYTNLHLLSITPNLVEYSAIHILSKREVRLKIQNNSKSVTLENETNYYTQLQDIQGIPEVIDYGVNGDERFYLALQVLGPSLYEIQKFNQFTLKNILLIGVQLIEIISHIHQKKLIVNNISPYSICLGPDADNQQLYIKDLTLMSNKGTLTNNNNVINRDWNFISHHFNEKTFPCQIDDLLSIGYVLLYFINGTLPWWNNGQITNQKQLQELQNIKLKFIQETQLPTFLREYFNYVLQLKMNQQPNYNYLKNILISKIYECGWKLNERFHLKCQLLTSSQSSLTSCKSRTRGTSIPKSPWLDSLSPIEEVDKELEFAFSLSGKQCSDYQSQLLNFNYLKDSITENELECNLSFNSSIQNECDIWKKMESLHIQSKPNQKMINPRKIE